MATKKPNYKATHKAREVRVIYAKIQGIAKYLIVADNNAKKKSLFFWLKTC